MIEEAMLPHVIIIVLNWNNCADTLACLDSLSRLDYPAFEIVVVDNGSTDDSVSTIRKRFPPVRVIENNENLGYTGGNNVGLHYALTTQADYVLLLNNDTVVAPDSLRLLVEAAEADTTIGIAGPTIYYYDDPTIIWSAGGAIDWRRGNTCMVGLNERDEGQFGCHPRAVDFVTGCAMLVRRIALEQIGLLDERFFAYYEDTEWCVRAQRAGFRVIHVPQAHIWHKIKPNIQANSSFVHYYMVRNHLLFLKSSKMRLSAWIYTIFLKHGRTILSWTLKHKWRDKRMQRNIMIKALLDFLQGHLGRAFIENRGAHENLE